MVSKTSGRPGGIYYGWIMLGICMIGLTLTVGTTVNAFGLYVVPVSEEYGLSRATMNTGMILMNAGAALAALLVGRMLDRYSIRLIMGASICILAISLFTFGISHSFWLSVVMISFPVGVAMKGIGILTGPSLVARWFSVHRGKAMAILMMGMSGGPIVVVPLIAWLIDSFGWRQSLVVLGCIVAALTLLLPFVRSSPGPGDHETGADSQAKQAGGEGEAVADTRPLSTLQLFAMPRFWALVMGTALTMAAFQGILVSLVPLAHDGGFSTTKAASLLSAMGIAAVSAKFTVALVADRFDRPSILAILFVLMALASALLAHADTYALLLACAALIGISAGATMPVFLALLADKFGVASMGTANGNATFVIAIISAGFVRFSGEVYDRTGGYQLMFYCFIAISLFSAALIFLTRFSGVRAALATAPS